MDLQPDANDLDTVLIEVANNHQIPENLIDIVVQSGLKKKRKPYGIHFSPYPTLEEIRKLSAEFAEARDWNQFHTPRNLLLALVGEVGVLSEIFQWKGEVKCGLPDWTEEEKKHFGEELSEVLLYLIRLSDRCGIDLPAEVLRKISLNEEKYPADKVYGSTPSGAPIPVRKIKSFHNNIKTSTGSPTICSVSAMHNDNNVTNSIDVPIIDSVSEINVDDNMTNVLDDEDRRTCHLCQTTFCTRGNLNKHFRKFHLEGYPIKRKQTSESYNFSCEVCNKMFVHKRSLDYHIQLKHNIRTTLKLTPHTCPICHEKFNKFNILKHFQDHGIDLDYSNLEFVSFEEFMIWKENIETDTKSKFIICRHWSDKQKTSYCCHRSGYYKSRARQRLMTMSASYKLNMFCPAEIKVMKLETGSCIVNFCQTHLGHEMEGP